MTYGEPLGETQLDAFVPAPGHFNYFINYGTPQQVECREAHSSHAGDGAKSPESGRQMIRINTTHW